MPHLEIRSSSQRKSKQQQQIISNRFNVTWKDRCRGCPPAFWHDQTCQPSLQPFEGWKKSWWKLLSIILSHFIHWLRKWGHWAIWTWYQRILQELNLSCSNHSIPNKAWDKGVINVNDWHKYWRKSPRSCSKCASSFRNPAPTSSRRWSPATSYASKLHKNSLKLS